MKSILPSLSGWPLLAIVTGCLAACRFADRQGPAARRSRLSPCAPPAAQRLECRRTAKRRKCRRGREIVMVDRRGGEPAAAPAQRPPDASGMQRACCQISQLASRLAQLDLGGRQGAVGRSAAPGKPAPDVALLLSSAVTAIESQASISARLRQKIHLLGHELVGSGSYEQIGRQEQRRFRLELKVPVGDGMSSFRADPYGQVSLGL